MTDLEVAVASFAAAELETWAGLPSEVHLADFEALLGFDRHDLRRGDAGDSSRTRLWVPAESAIYHGGLRLWLDDNDGERVVLLEGLNPLDPDGEPVLAPDLGDPDATFEAVLGPFHVRDAEKVYAARGLALQVNPENGVLVGVIGFAPTDVADYRRRLQPHREPTQPFPKDVPR